MMKKASQREEDDMYIFPATCIGRTKQWWWYLFEYPSLSLRSRTVALISFFFVLLSTVVLVVSTLLEDFHRNDLNCKPTIQPNNRPAMKKPTKPDSRCTAQSCNDPDDCY